MTYGKTQRERIIEALRLWTSPAEAFRTCGTLKLATRVGEIRKLGYDIEDKWEENHRYKLYRIKPKEVFVPKTEWRGTSTNVGEEHGVFVIDVS
jgi:hypothetical protein